MYKLDHLMVEVEDPQTSAERLADVLGVPLAWDSIANQDYISVGVNLGDLNIEFVNFKVKFGNPNSLNIGFTGAAFQTHISIDETEKYLKEKSLGCKIANLAQAKSILTVEEDKIYPTLYLVKYNFDTDGWKTRLKNEFKAVGGGKYAIQGCEGLKLNDRLPPVIQELFDVEPGVKNQICFKCNIKETAVLDNLIENLEIVLLSSSYKV